jgi:hypothetical protein
MCVVDADVKYPLGEFIKEVRGYLADSHGWKSRGYSFREVKTNPRCVIHLSSPREILEAGCKDPSLSCAELGGKHLRLNAMRWTTGAKKSELPLKDYRQYMVTHEMGHILGFDHDNEENLTVMRAAELAILTKHHWNGTVPDGFQQGHNE